MDVDLDVTPVPTMSTIAETQPREPSSELIADTNTEILTKPKPLEVEQLVTRSTRKRKLDAEQEVEDSSSSFAEMSDRELKHEAKKHLMMQQSIALRQEKLQVDWEMEEIKYRQEQTRAEKRQRRK